MFYYVYVLLSLKDKKFYIGFSENIEKRLLEHNSGKVKSTKNRKPFRLLCYEAYLTKSEALAREKYLKSSDARKEFKIRLKKTLGSVA